MADNGPTIIELDRKRMTAMAEKDIATLNTLLADDLVYTHSSARIDTKQSLIGNMEFRRDRLQLGRAVGREGAGPWQRRRVDWRRAHPCHLWGQAQRIFRPLHRRLRQPRRQMANGRLAIHPSSGLNLWAIG